VIFKSRDFFSLFYGNDLELYQPARGIGGGGIAHALAHKGAANGGLMGNPVILGIGFLWTNHLVGLGGVTAFLNSDTRTDIDRGTARG